MFFISTDDDTVEDSISKKAEERGQTAKLETQKRASSRNTQPSSSESGVISDAEIVQNQELNTSATFDAGICSDAYSEASGNHSVIIESHHNQEQGVVDAASGNEDSVKEITSSVSHLNQEEADPAAGTTADLSTVSVTDGGETQAPTEVASEIVENNGVSQPSKEVIDRTHVAIVPQYDYMKHLQNLTGPFLQEEAENTCDEGTTSNETVKEEEVDSHDLPLSK